MAATQVTGLREMFGSDSKSFHIGRAAQNGVLAAMLARGGYTSSLQALEAKRGWANIVGVTKANVIDSLNQFIGVGDAAKANVGLAVPGGGGRWELPQNAFKAFPCGVVIHPIIDAGAQVRSQLLAKGKSAKDIAKVFMRVHPLVIELTGKRKPRDSLEAKFSGYYGAAIGLMCGKGGLAEYTDDAVLNPDVVDLRDRVDAEVDMGVAADAVIMTVTMKDGEVIELNLPHCLGSVERPMTKETLTDKFKDQCTKILGKDVDQASEAIWGIEASSDVSQITKYL
jgi:aconitate decarboxylase